MRLVRRSVRIRKARSRMSRTSNLCGGPSTKHYGKRKSSRIEEDRPVLMISKTLSFDDADQEPTQTPSPATGTGRRQSARLLRRKSLQRSPLITTPALSAITNGNESPKPIDESGLKQINLPPGDENRIVESMFGEIFDQASLCKVEVEQCVSLPELRVRPLHQFGIQRAVHLLSGKSIGSVTGHVCVGKFPVVAELPDEYEDRILEYFCSKGRKREASKRFIASRTIYHVVNGGYEHEGRWRLIDSSGYQFTGVTWRAACIPWQDPRMLRAISMMSSQVQKKELVVELSFLDEMVHLRRVIEEYLTENTIVLLPGKALPRGFCKNVSNAYSGGTEYSNGTLRHMISIAAKMSVTTVALMRQVIDEECPRLAKSIHRKYSSEDSPDVIDTRVFRTLLNSKSLRGAKSFSSPDTNDEDRQNALQRLRYMAQEKGSYKGVDSSTLDNQVAAAISGRQAVNSFRLRILRNEAWPPAIKPLLRNILWTTKLDTEIAENVNRPEELLHTLKYKYLECAGVEGGSRVEQYEKFILDQARNLNENSAPNNSLSASAAEELAIDDRGQDRSNQVEINKSWSAGSGGGASCNVGSPIAQQGDHDKSGETKQWTGAVAESESESEQWPEPDPLQQCGVELHGLPWEDYNRTVLTEQEIFDLVISDPFQKAAAARISVMDEEQRSQFMQFVKKVLVPGGYVFLIVAHSDVSVWLETFQEFELKGEGIFTLVKDPESVQRVKGKSFQQNLVEVAVVARKQGRHPAKFVMDVTSPYTQLPRNRYKRRAPVIDNISPPSNRLRFPKSKTLVRTAEKSPALFWELMKTFCPPGGKVLDPAAGTLTTGIAAIQSGRPCVLLEAHKECFSLAEARLRKIAIRKVEELKTGHMLLELGIKEDNLDLEQEGASSSDAELDSPNLRSSSCKNKEFNDSEILSEAPEQPQHCGEATEENINLDDDDECVSALRSGMHHEMHSEDGQARDREERKNHINGLSLGGSGSKNLKSSIAALTMKDFSELESCTQIDIVEKTDYQNRCLLGNEEDQSAVDTSNKSIPGTNELPKVVSEVPNDGASFARVSLKRKRNHKGNFSESLPVIIPSRAKRKKKKTVRYA